MSSIRRDREQRSVRRSISAAMPERIGTVIIGGGQAGLSVSRELAQAGVGHVVLERGRVGQSWRGRWDSFCLVTPNWSVQLPGHAYDGPDPDGFMPRDELVTPPRALRDARSTHRYARASRSAPSRPQPDGGFALATSAGDIVASAVVLCTGAYQRPHRPAGAATLPADLHQIDVVDYRNPGELPPGQVLVVGSGQSGCQIAEELHEGGRDVLLACGRAGWGPRRMGGTTSSGGSTRPATSTTGWTRCRTQPPGWRANLQASGQAGGHDLHYRTLQRMGVTLLGHFLGVEGRQGRFAADLAETVAFADQRNAKLMEGFRKAAVRLGLPEPEIPDPEPIEVDTPELVDLAGSGRWSLRAGSAPTTAPGSTARAPSTSSGFRSMRREPARWLPGSISWGSTACGSASRRF